MPAALGISLGPGVSRRSENSDLRDFVAGNRKLIANSMSISSRDRSVPARIAA
jgi:hypothetical protein